MHKKILRGLLLEGGAARGAYQAGAYRALRAAARHYDVIVGVSVGSINGASFVLHPDGRSTWSFWKNLNLTEILGDLTLENGKFALPLFKKILRNHGISIHYLRQYLKDKIDEQAIRKSSIDFGLTTLEMNPLRNLKLFKDDIKEGELLDYIIASSALPIFKIEPIRDRFLIDGGLGGALPIGMLIEKGCTEIDVIRTMAVNTSWSQLDATIELFIPSQPLRAFYDFRHEAIMHNMQQGYFDTLRKLKGYYGEFYYFKEQDTAAELLLHLPIKRLRTALYFFEQPAHAPRREFFTFLLPQIYRAMNLSPKKDYETLAIQLLELTAKYYQIERFRLHTSNSLMTEIREQIKQQGVPQPSPTNPLALLFLPRRLRNLHLIRLTCCLLGEQQALE